MAVRISIPFDVNDKVKVLATGRDGWVEAIQIGANRRLQFYCATTNDDGRPMPAWFAADAIEAAT